MKPYYEHTGITLYHGDCLEILPTLPAASVDLVLCDLPYGTTTCKWDLIIPFEPLWGAYHRLSKPTTPVVLMCQQPFTSKLICSNLGEQKYMWVWDKKFAGNFSTVNKRPLKTHEEVAVFYRKQPTYNPQMTNRDKPIKSGKRCQPRNRTGTAEVVNFEAPQKVYDKKHPTSIIAIPRDIGVVNCHPTQKPVALMEYLIRTYTNPGDTVLDNCMGSGTTGVACVNTGRSFIGIEIEERYCEIAAKRLAQEVTALNGSSTVSPGLDQLRMFA